MLKQQVPARFCLPYFKHMLGVPITFSDLAFVDGTLHRSLQVRTFEHRARTAGTRTMRLALCHLQPLLTALPSYATPPSLLFSPISYSSAPSHWTAALLATLPPAAFAAVFTEQ